MSVVVREMFALNLSASASENCQQNDRLLSPSASTYLKPWFAPWWAHWTVYFLYTMHILCLFCCFYLHIICYYLLFRIIWKLHKYAILLGMRQCLGRKKKSLCIVFKFFGILCASVDMSNCTNEMKNCNSFSSTSVLYLYSFTFQ